MTIKIIEKLDREFEWDEQKNIKNQEKHGIRFEDVLKVSILLLFILKEEKESGLSQSVNHIKKRG